MKAVNIGKSDITLLRETIYRIVQTRASLDKYNHSKSVCQVVSLDFIVLKVRILINKVRVPACFWNISV